MLAEVVRSRFTESRHRGSLVVLAPDGRVAWSLGDVTSPMLFVAVFAAAGLVTAVTGVYALLAYTVAQRRREIAVRMAIGASSFSVARLVVMESVMLAVAGCVLVGLGVAAFSRLARSVLFGIAPQDPLTLATTAAVLFTAVLAASWLPARRAATIDPVSAMRL